VRRQFINRPIKIVVCQLLHLLKPEVTNTHSSSKLFFSFKNKLKVLLFTHELKEINMKVVIFQEPTQRDVCGNAGTDVHITCDGVRTQKSQYVEVIPVHTMKANRGSGRTVQVHVLSTSALDRTERSALGLGLLIPGEKLLVPTDHEAGWDPLRHILYGTKNISGVLIAGSY
jgi:hypothetical protein